MGTKKIKILRNGPYVVTGNIPLNKLVYVSDKKGASTEYKLIETYSVGETYSLCRCGESKNKPFCDGAHLKNNFDGAEAASHKTYEEQAELIEGKMVDLLDAEDYCAVARFCDTYETTWNIVAKSTEQEKIDIAIQQCNDCPSGRLTIVTKDGQKIEPELPMEISILEDAYEKKHGPIWVKGGIIIEDENGDVFPIRNRVTLCRCGMSTNKPFCDYKHLRNKKDDYLCTS